MLLLLVLLRWQRIRADRGWPTWMALAPERAAQHQHLSETIERHMGELRDTCELLHRRGDSGSDDQVRALMKAAVELVELLVPDLIGRLQEWSRVASALALVAPTRRLSAGCLQMPSLKGLALGWAMLEAFLVAARDRFRLRAWVLRGGLTLVAASFREHFASGAGRAPGWPRIAMLQSDLGTLSGASLDTYQALLLSLERRARERR